MSNETQAGRKAERKELTEDIKEYLNLRMQIIRLNITEKISVAMAGLVSSAVLMVLYLLVILLLSIALAWWLGGVFENTALGFAAVGGFYLLLAIIIRILFNRRLRGRIADKFISDFSSDD